MKLKLFIDRPILACSISLLILMLGIISLVNLPMEQYPDIAPPTIQVSATYTGASAETVLKSVIVPLEEEINGVENMLYMTSTATNTGTATINVYFKQGIRYFNIDLPVRFDIVTLIKKETGFLIDHIEDAFYAPCR